MRKLSFSLVIAAIVAVSAVTLNPPTPVAASPADDYSGPYFGAGNLPPGCENDVLVGDLELRALSTFQDPKSFNNVCHHMRTGLNALDSPQVDVLVMVPVSPTAERDMRIMRQSVEMWEGGIDYLAEEMGLGWLAEGVDFHVTIDYFDPTGDDGGEFTTYPIVDPEIVVIAANPLPFAHAGIGIDPFADTPQNRCNAFPVGNPFDIEEWGALPGFNSHHEGRSGTYTEDCSANGGGNTCFAVNAGGDPPVIDVLSLFDLVSHEFGHCLTLGHVGDGAEGKWGKNASNDIMAYSADPPGINKCVSTLDVEAFAVRMSRYLDVNGDGAVAESDRLFTNDQRGQGGNPFQVQHPDDHLYASGTGDVMACPQPDLGELPGERVDWTPDPIKTSQPVLTIASPQDGAVSTTGVFNVTGTVERVALNNDPVVTETTGSIDDADDDATSPVTEIQSVDVAVTDTHVTATMRVGELTPASDGASASSYTLLIDGRKFDSFVYGIGFDQPRTYDDAASLMMPDGTSSWDTTAKTVTFRIPRDYLANSGVSSPYFLTTSASFGNPLFTQSEDDRAPDGDDTIGVAGPSSAMSLGVTAPLSGNLATQTFEQEGGNTFYPEESTLGVTAITTDLTGVDLDPRVDPSHVFALDVPETSDVELDLTWTDAVGGADLDLYVTGAADSGSTGATATTGAPAEKVTFESVTGALNLRVEPYFVTDPLEGSTYTLTATVTPVVIEEIDTDLDGILDSADACPTEAGVAPTGCPDADGDGVKDSADVCPDVAGSGADGCPILATEQVHLWVGGAIAASQDVDTVNGPDTFNLPVALSEGTYEVRVDWERKGKVVASRTMTLTHDTDDDDDGVANDADVCPGWDDNADGDGDGIADGCDTDSDGDGFADLVDNCADNPNPDQADLDGDGVGDACDSDIDGDRHANGKEKAHGTDPRDASSFPTKSKTAGL